MCGLKVELFIMRNFTLEFLKRGLQPQVVAYFYKELLIVPQVVLEASRPVR